MFIPENVYSLSILRHCAFKKFQNIASESQIALSLMLFWIVFGDVILVSSVLKSDSVFAYFAYPNPSTIHYNATSHMNGYHTNNITNITSRILNSYAANNAAFRSLMGNGINGTNGNTTTPPPPFELNYGDYMVNPN